MTTTFYSHGYGPYSRGCRCEVCRKAKADYMRERRAASRVMAHKHTVSSTGKRGTRGSISAPGATRYIAPITEHGSRAGYDEHGCRCYPCTAARRKSDQRTNRNRRTRRAESGVA